jgi:SAM-dependent methyltransferase
MLTEGLYFWKTKPPNKEYEADEAKHIGASAYPVARGRVPGHHPPNLGRQHSRRACASPVFRSWRKRRRSIRSHRGANVAHDESTQNRITGFWNTIAAEYEAHEGNVAALGSNEYKAWVEALRDLLPSAPADVLDVGTGTGFVAMIAGELGHRVVGTDLSEAMLGEARREARQRGVLVRLEVGDAVTPEFPAESFDAIVARHLLWTLREPEEAFQNWRALLRPGGRVVAIDGHWFGGGDDSDDSDAPELFRRHYTRDTRSVLPLMRASEPQPIVEMFRRAGFAAVELSYLTRVHVLAEHPPSEDPWFVLVAKR